MRSIVDGSVPEKIKAIAPRLLPEHLEDLNERKGFPQAFFYERSKDCVDQYGQDGVPFSKEAISACSESNRLKGIFDFCSLIGLTAIALDLGKRQYWAERVKEMENPQLPSRSPNHRPG